MVSPLLSAVAESRTDTYKAKPFPVFKGNNSSAVIPFFYLFFLPFIRKKPCNELPS